MDFSQGNLPVALIFDYPENSIKPDDITALNHKFNVFIAVRQKSRQSTLCIVIKGVEKYVGKSCTQNQIGIVYFHFLSESLLLL